MIAISVVVVILTGTGRPSAVGIGGIVDLLRFLRGVVPGLQSLLGGHKAIERGVASIGCKLYLAAGGIIGVGQRLRGEPGVVDPGIGDVRLHLVRLVIDVLGFGGAFPVVGGGIPGEGAGIDLRAGGVEGVLMLALARARAISVVLPNGRTDGAAGSIVVVGCCLDEDGIDVEGQDGVRQAGGSRGTERGPEGSLQAIGDLRGDIPSRNRVGNYIRCLDISRSRDVDRIRYDGILRLHQERERQDSGEERYVA